MDPTVLDLKTWSRTSKLHLNVCTYHFFIFEFWVFHYLFRMARKVGPYKRYFQFSYLSTVINWFAFPHFIFIKNNMVVFNKQVWASVLVVDYALECISFRCFGWFDLCPLSSNNSSTNMTITEIVFTSSYALLHNTSWEF